MDLKSLLISNAKENIESLRKAITENEKLLLSLEQIDVNNAEYRVHLHDLWENEGGKSTTTTTKGTLKEAIKRAEQRFKQINHRSDVQANYSVDLLIGKERYSVPKCYWQQFKEN